MIKGIAAANATGMPPSHARAFQGVANDTGCVISSRAVGIYATGLLLESYATKGFHNKAKSCPWGPMAGFVMADPRFTKNPDISGQRTDLTKAVKEGGGETPLYISDARRLALEGPLKRIVFEPKGSNINEKHYSAPTPTGGTMKFVLKRALDAPGADGMQLWAVHYGRGEVRLSNDLESPNTPAGNSLLPVMAMIDPACPNHVRRTYRAATTGDYDLFAVFPPRGDYNRRGADQRMVPGSDRFKVGIKGYIANEDKHRGNLTPRIAAIRELLNQRITGEAGYRGGDVVHHSDEVGRPMVSNIEFPFIAFVPGEAEAYGVDSLIDFKSLIAHLMTRYVITFNPGWHRHFGFSVSPGGSYET